MSDYRKIWESFYGKIPKDVYGRSYEIHHKDGDRKNNNIDNLICVSIKEHYEIHLKQSDWAACARMSYRMQLPVEEKSILAKLASQGKKWITNGMVDKFIQHDVELPEGFKYGRSSGLNYGPRSNEFKMKMSKIRKGKPLSEDHKNKLKGLKRGMTGKKHSDETKQKMRKPKTTHHANAISESKKGKTNIPHTTQTRLKMSESQKLRRLKERYIDND